jgi:hypothetical protein
MRIFMAASGCSAVSRRMRMAKNRNDGRMAGAVTPAQVYGSHLVAWFAVCDRHKQYNNLAEEANGNLARDRNGRRDSRGFLMVIADIIE